tara:strand:+ start:246 stop:443 length:198 start_codon:yes stop_codon:yes gene_type:complete
MTTKEKAEELYLNFEDSITGLRGNEWYETAKKCALIAVKFAKENPLNTNDYNKYLDELKQEIKKI